MDDIIINYLEGNASEEEMQKLLDWIRKDNVNRKHFLESRDLWLTITNSLTMNSDIPYAFDQFKQDVIRYEEKKKSKRFKLNFLKYAASITLLIGYSLGIYLLGNKHPEATPPELAIHQTIIRNDKTEVVLPDGTKVWLNRNSKLSYPEKFNDKERLVKLEGEGYFEVIHKESSPFFVEANELLIKVLGTEFDVKSYSDDLLAEVVLLSGKVDVSFINRKESFELTPNQKILFNTQTGEHSLESLDANEYALWKNDKLIMNNEELETIFKKMGRWYNTEITYENGIPLQSKFSITITDESKEEILRLLSIAIPIRYEIKSDKIIIKKK